jgi:diguanylate cyclase (GGDEF)-like protein
MRTQRYLKPISVLLIDIDHLGQINATHGIPCGDQVLAQVARLLVDTTRATDIVGRYGGEEFIVALPETNRDSAHTTAEKLRKRIEESAFRFGGKEVTVTVSIGVASSEGAPSIADLVAQANFALEAAKRAGRNRVSVEVSS